MAQRFASDVNHLSIALVGTIALIRKCDWQCLTAIIILSLCGATWPQLLTRSTAMAHKPINQAIDTMNVMDQARALRGMHQAMALGNLFDAIVSGVHGAFSDAGRAMALVYGRVGR